MPKATSRTTFTLPTALLEAVDRAVHAGDAPSRNAFVYAALRHELAARERRAIDAAFAEMAHDDAYQSEAEALAGAFMAADWEAFREAERPVADGDHAAR